MSLPSSVPRSGARPSWTAGGIAFFMVLAFFVFIFGAAASLADPLVIAVLITLVGSFAMLFFPDALLWIVVLGGLVVAGVLEIYLPTLQVLRWGFAGASVLLLVAVVLRDHLLGGRAPVVRAEHPPAILRWALAFLAVCGMSTLLNWNGIGHVIFGWKGYFQLWGLFLSLALTRQTPTLFRKAPRLLLGIAFLQLPFVAEQFAILVPQRKGLPGVVPADIVAGTFGGSVVGGGANSLLALYLLSTIAVLVALWRAGAFAGRRWPLPAAGLLMLPLFFNESKASIVLLTVAFVLIFREDIRLRPVRFAGFSLGLIALLAGLLFSYTMLSDRAADRDPIYYLEHAVQQNSSEGFRYGGYELNRFTSLKFWAEQRPRYGAKEFLLGHGLGESRDQLGVIDLASDTLASVRYRGLGIGVTTAAGLLWEVGVVGTLIVAAMLFSAFRLAGRLARRAKSAWERGWFNGIQAVVAMVALSLLHNNFFLFHFEYQTFVLLLLGYLCYVGRQVNAVAGSSPAYERQASA